jgi:hypothetical protein
MNVFDLMERLNGEILANKVRAIIDSKIVILAELADNEWVPTERGQELLNLHSNIVADELVAEVPAKVPAEVKTSKKKAPLVESVNPPAEPEIELDPVTDK